MTIQECKRRERIYKKLVEKFQPTSTFDSNDMTPEELECIKVALLRSVAIEILFELETRGDWDGVKAWADMPKYKGGDSDA